MALTDNEIIKALEHCTSTSGNGCTECPLNAPNCYARVPMAFALDLITRQKAEIERLNNNISAMAITLSNSAKATSHDAIKEFAEGLEKYIKTKCNPYGKPTFDFNTSVSIMRYIDNLVKEMVGEE